MRVCEMTLLTRDAGLKTHGETFGETAAPIITKITLPAPKPTKSK